MFKIGKYKILQDGSYFGDIPGVSGIWANAKTLEECQEQLEEVLREWITLKV